MLDWDDGGEVVIELEEATSGTRVRVVESSPEFATALGLRALARGGRRRRRQRSSRRSAMRGSRSLVEAVATRGTRDRDRAGLRAARDAAGGGETARRARRRGAAARDARRPRDALRGDARRRSRTRSPGWSRSAPPGTSAWPRCSGASRRTASREEADTLSSRCLTPGRGPTRHGPAGPFARARGARSSSRRPGRGRSGSGRAGGCRGAARTPTLRDDEETAPALGPRHLAAANGARARRAAPRAPRAPRAARSDSTRARPPGRRAAASRSRRPTRRQGAARPLPRPAPAARAAPSGRAARHAGSPRARGPCASRGC